LDLVPFKVCTYDCVYCQLGGTTLKTVDRKEYVSASKLLCELEARLKTNIHADYVTLAGSGEPTLNGSLKEIVRETKNMTGIPLAVITNGSLLFMDEVKEALSGTDLLIPSLDAGSGASFRRVNRPHGKIRFDSVVEGLMSLKDWYKGRVWLESLVVGGSTDSDSEIEKIAALVDDISPEKVQLNTVVRPPAKPEALEVPRPRMEQFASFFRTPVEIIGYKEGSGREDSRPVPESADSEILELVRRRPVTVRDIALGLGIPANEALKRTGQMFKEGRITATEKNGQIFYIPAEGSKNEP